MDIYINEMFWDGLVTSSFIHRISGSSSAAGVRVHPEGWEGSDPHVHPDGVRLPFGLDSLCQLCCLDLLQQGSCLLSCSHGHPCLLLKEFSIVQPYYLRPDEQTGQFIIIFQMVLQRFLMNRIGVFDQFWNQHFHSHTSASQQWIVCEQTWRRYMMEIFYD